MDTNQSIAGDRKAVLTSSFKMDSLYAPPAADVVVDNNKEIPDAAKADAKAYTDGMAKLVEDADKVDPVVVEDEADDEVKKSPKLKERFSELTGKAKAAEKAAKEAADAREAERVARQQAEQERDALRAKYEPPKTELGPKPIREQFTDDAEWEKALFDYASEKAEFDLTKRQHETAAKEHADRVQKGWNEGVAKAIKETADYSEVVGKSTVTISPEATQAIMEADNGPAILYHLAKNPDVAEKWKGLTVPAMNREVGKLSAKLETAPQQTKGKTLAETVASEISKAPAPISPARGVPSGAGSYDVSKMDYPTYKALRDAGKIK